MLLRIRIEMKVSSLCCDVHHLVLVIISPGMSDIAGLVDLCSLWNRSKTLGSSLDIPKLIILFGLYKYPFWKIIQNIICVWKWNDLKFAS